MHVYIEGVIMKLIERLTNLDFNRTGGQVPASVNNVGLYLMDTPSDFENNEIKSLLSKPSDLYPGFDNWYRKSSKEALKTNFFFDDELKGKNISGFERCINNQRHPKMDRYFLVLSINDIPAGISILKNSDYEKKISTFNIENKYKNLGLANYLMSRSLDILGRKGVSITVNESIMDELYPFLEKRGFMLDKKVLEEYMKNKNEYHLVKVK